jgi:hypothetical protein
VSTTTTTAAIALPLGTTPDGETVSWHLTDDTGRPLHGLIVGPPGAGGTTALMRLATSAHAAGVQPNIVTLTHDLNHPDQAWLKAPRSETSWHTDTEWLISDIDDLLTETTPAPRLFLVDGGAGLRAAPEQWMKLIRQAARVRASIVARVHRPILPEFGYDDVLRSHLTAHGQYLALGRPAPSPLVRALLPGYIPPAYQGQPGTGVYGHAWFTTEVTVTA